MHAARGDAERADRREGRAAGRAGGGEAGERVEGFGQRRTPWREPKRKTKKVDEEKFGTYQIRAHGEDDAD